MKRWFFLNAIILVGISLFDSCKTKSTVPISDTDILQQNQDILTQVIIYDAFTPPVASRIYAYSSLASYEAIKYNVKGSPSIAEKLNGFQPMPLLRADLIWKDVYH